MAGVGEPQDKFSSFKPHEMWQVCRDHIRHENELLDHRIVWTLGLHGFAFTVFAGVIALQHQQNYGIRFLPLIAAFAILASWLMHPFIAAAIYAHQRWAGIWDDYAGERPFPDVVGYREDPRDETDKNDENKFRKWVRQWMHAVRKFYCLPEIMILPSKDPDILPEHSAFQLLEAITSTWFWLGIVSLAYLALNKFGLFDPKNLPEAGFLIVAFTFGFVLGVGALGFVFWSEWKDR